MPDTRDGGKSKPWDGLTPEQEGQQEKEVLTEMTPAQRAEIERGMRGESTEHVLIDLGDIVDADPDPSAGSASSGT